MKIVFLDRKTLGYDVDLERFKEFGEVEFFDSTKKEETLKRVKDANIVVTNKVVIDKNIMDNSNIELICVAATGMNNIDLEYAKQKNITVKNVAGYSTPSVVQLTFAMALYLINHLKYYDNYTKDKDGWIKNDVFTKFEPTFFDLENKKWGIIGLGEIGKKVAKTAKCFGCDVFYFSTSGKNNDLEFKKVDLDQLLKESDIISIHAPLNKNTNNLINSTNLPLLKDNVILLNLGRGGIVNEEDLVEYMNKSNIKVAFDVLTKEPIDENSPFWKVKNKDNLLLTPHLAWASIESRKRLVDGIYKNIQQYLGEKR